MSDFLHDVGNYMHKTFDKMGDESKNLRNAAAKMIAVDDDDGRTPRKETPDDLEDPDKEQHVLESMRHWDVTMPGTRPKTRFGVKMPSIRRTFNKTRRITIELYKKGLAPGQDPMEQDYDKRVFEKLNPRASVMEGLDTNALESEDLEPLGEDDFIIFRILKQVKPKKGIAGAYEWDDDDSHASSHFNGAYESNKLITYNVEDYGDGKSQEDLATHWMERQRARIPTMEITEVTDLLVKINIGVGDNTILREFNFESRHDVETFVKTFGKMQELMYERGNRMAAEHRTGKKRGSFVDEGILQSLSKGSEVPVNILIEVVSASNLPIAGKLWGCFLFCSFVFKICAFD